MAARGGLDLEFQRCCLKLKTESGLVPYGKMELEDRTSCVGEHKIKSLFETQDSNLWALLYILSFSDSVVEFTEDEEVIEIFRSSNMDMVTDLIYKPLNKGLWSDASIVLDQKMIEKVLQRFKNTSIRYSTSPTVLVFLDLLIKGITGLRCNSMMDDELYPTYGGIYDLFEFLGGLSYGRTIHLARIDTKYQTRNFVLLEDYRQAYSVTMHSAHMFCDKKLESLLRVYKANTSVFKDVLVYDLDTEMEVEPSIVLSKLRGRKLALSTLLTNIWNPELLVTFRVRCASNPNLWFLFTCQLENSDESLIYGLREMMMSLMKVRHEDQVVFKATVAGEVISASFSDSLTLFRRVYKHRDRMFSKFLTVEFEFASLSLKKINEKTRTVHHFKEELGPKDILEDYYKMRTTRLTHSEASCQLLLIEYNDSLGIDTGSLCKDIQSEWLEKNPTYYYQLKGVIAQERSLHGESLMIPLAKTQSREWYSPFHDCSVSGLASILDIRCYIYEKSFTPLW